MSKRRKSGKNKKSIPGIIIAVLVLAVLGFIGGGDEGESTVSTTENSEKNQISTSDFNTFGDNISDDTTSKDDRESSTQSKDDATENNTPNTTKKQNEKDTTVKSVGNYKVSLNGIPAFSGKAYVSVNGNVPGLTSADRTSKYFEKYSPLDYMGRCGVVVACLGRETMPTEERGGIGMVKPTGWHTVKYDCVDGKYLYNRCHLIGFQLSGENANERNLITGTRYMNIQGMLPFENMVADYIKETNNHVLYRVTPVFKGNEKVARGVQIEAYSVEDNGEGICFNVYCYNNQPGVKIDYATGESALDNSVAVPQTTRRQNQSQGTQKPVPSTKKEQATTQKETTKPQTQSGNNVTAMYILNTNSKKIHRPSCAHVSRMNESNKESYTGDINDLYNMGYTTCGSCF